MGSVWVHFAEFIIVEVQGIVNPITTKLYSGGSSGSSSADDDEESGFDHDEL